MCYVDTHTDDAQYFFLCIDILTMSEGYWIKFFDNNSDIIDNYFSQFCHPCCKLA
jgi:hypothetical protein